MQETTTRSPGWNFFTSGPTLATVPMNCMQADHTSSGLMRGTGFNPCSSLLLFDNWRCT